MKIRKLKEIIMSIAEINTSVSIEDVMEVASINSWVYDDIRLLKQKLSNIVIKPTEVEPSVNNEERKFNTEYIKPDEDVVKFYAMNQPGGKPRKMSIEQAVSCCMFLRQIAPVSYEDSVKALTEYTNRHMNKCNLSNSNIKDFINGHSYRRISPKFFTKENDYIYPIK